MRLILKAEYPAFFKIVLGTAAMVVAYGILHDQYLIRVSARHFTEFHPAIFDTENITLLALGFAVMATFGPGLVLGYLMYAAARLGQRVRAEPGGVFLTVLVLLLLLELIAVSTGQLAPLLNEHDLLPFPPELYPDSTPEILITQTTQLVAYLLAPVLSGLGLAWVYFRRAKAGVN
ncbi:hypothetical protein H5P28_03355 [Ruficoccus amylovorans]|uniref:Uncharacterized protein n=1 Tax=Ruficoccus amylovorans TaxID=1804625 RepID=A0A842HD38_9BACT|nr:hypothetical protein [Ruficoccus amylovorans]MBC2593291.1 hypothetical protein [Ruficoccus amylovorans]